MSTTTTTPRTIHTAAAELTAAGYETHITRDGWLCVYGPQTATAYWEAWFSPNDGNDVTVGEVPQAVFDLAYFETTPRYTVSNAFEIYGDPLPEECTAETLEQTTLEMATRMACVWGTADADGMVDISAHLQGRDEREESETGVSDEIDHSNSILDVAEENGGKIAFAELVLFIKCDALEVEENDESGQITADRAHLRTGCPSCLGTVPAGAVDWGCYCNASQDEVDEANAFMRLICD